MNILVSPHNDDEGLFASYIIQRTHPWVLVVMDAVQHSKKFDIPVETRRNESEQACAFMGVPVEFLGVSDETANQEKIQLALMDFADAPDLVFAPALTGGNLQHDMVSRIAQRIWGNKVIFYGTYSKESLTPTGEMAIIPTEEEKRVKEQVLRCYKSQLGINKAHFDAVEGKPEYLSFKP